MNTRSPLRAIQSLTAFSLIAAALIAPPAFAAAPVVLFDEGHGQRFTSAGAGELDLSALAGIIGKAGAEVRAHKEKIGPATLSNVRGLVMSGPFEPYSVEEAAALKEFLSNGGRLSIMMHIGQPFAELMDAFNIVFSRGVLHEQDGLINGKTQDFKVTRLEKHPVMEGVGEFAVYGGWAVKNNGPEAWSVATTGPRSWLDLDNNRTYTKGEPISSFAVALAGSYGKGSFLIFGDDAIFQNRFLEGGNRRLAEQLASWLVNR
jgi:hypothetical protein